jgi:hypothetical protein
MLANAEKIGVQRYNERHRRFLWVGELERAAFDATPNAVAERGGGGIYRLYPMKGRDVVGEGMEFPYDEATFGPSRPFNGPLPEPEPAPNGNGHGLDEEKVARIVSGALDARLGVAGGGSRTSELKDLADVVKTLMPAQPVAAAGGDPSAVMNAFMQGFGLGRNTAGFDWNKALDKFCDTVDRTLEKFTGPGVPSTRVPAPNGNGGGNGNGAGNPPPADTRTVNGVPLALMIEAINLLAGCASSNVKPEEAAAQVWNAVAPRYYEPLNEALARTDLFELMFTINVGLREHRAYLDSVLAVLRPHVAEIVKTIREASVTTPQAAGT